MARLFCALKFLIIENQTFMPKKFNNKNNPLKLVILTYLIIPSF